MPSRIAIATVLGLVVLTAGCIGTPETATSQPSATPSSAPTATPPGGGSIDFPDGPKAVPDRPATLSESTVSDFVYDYEYNYVYNKLWQGEHTEMDLECRVDSVTELSRGYEAVVTCDGGSTTELPAGATGTEGPIMDYFTQSFRYRVTDTATARERVETRRNGV
ncbi:hypothetical protein NDI56_00900 [Haloarcula sp. S1CR25-12]|uniref:Lipoprotein n=1 Tax=Haloarcula saliterrae TaxID=2950534 RepID=A0ABU2F884_9EURY|nr:hypothetical protein [Haloarcula sp. S1CR25-12]MDS0257960.1 hypothetical protein [Haloarcula sp. S1CR25-12]